MKVYVTEHEHECLMTLARRDRKDISEYMRHLLRARINQAVHGTLFTSSTIPPTN